MMPIEESASLRRCESRKGDNKSGNTCKEMFREEPTVKVNLFEAVVKALVSVSQAPILQCAVMILNVFSSLPLV